MRTVSTSYEYGKTKTRGHCAWIVYLDDGTTEFYLSSKAIKLDDVSVLPLLTGDVHIRKQVDVFTKRNTNSDVRITIDNGPGQFADDTGATFRFSDIVDSLFGATLSLYLHVGEHINTLSDCLLYFSGTIVTEPEFDAKSVTIQARDIIYDKDRILPQTLIESVYSAVPERSQGRKIPLVWGNFDIDGDNGNTFALSGDGLALCEWVSGSKVVVSDHDLDSFAELWHREQGITDPCLCISPTLNVSDSGRGTAEFKWTNHAYAFIQAVHAEEWLQYRVSSYYPTDVENATDRNPATYATLNDDDLDNGSLRRGHAVWVIDEDGWIVGIMSTSRFAEIACQVRALRSYILTNEDLYLWYGYFIDEHVAVSFPTSAGWVTGVVAAPDLSVKTDPFGVGVRMGTVYLCDGIRNNASIGRVYDVRVRVEFRPEMLQNDRFAACGGREYGSWITESSRSVGGLAAGDLIRHPAHIIESILRDELGVTTTEIDTASFDAVYVSTHYARMNLHSSNEMEASRAIRQLCEQYSIAFVWSGDAKARLIDLSANPSSPRTIPLGHVVDEYVKVSKTTWMVNKMNLQSRFQQEYGNKYRDAETVQNTGSQTDYGVRELSTRWPNIEGAAVSYMKSHLITASTGLWKNEHFVVEFATHGATHSDLELGDGIQFDHTEIDSRLLLHGGASWEDVVFMIVSTDQRDDRTVFTGINLYE